MIRSARSHAVRGAAGVQWNKLFAPRNLCAWVVAAAVLLIALYFAATTLCAIIIFGWRQPMFDQYRSYAILLSLPFPQDILQLENGHRPVIPNLIRVAEINWFAANQLLQISIGTFCAFLSAAIVAACAWRTRELPLIARAGGVLLATLGVLWLANARMLLHGNESLHVYIVTLSVICACLCVWRSQQLHSLGWFAGASAACVVATFSFGSGIASFPSIVALGVLFRLPYRWQIVPLATLAACMLLYLYLLPGDQGVRGVLELHPLESARICAQWLAAPWINGWLGAADPAASWVPVDPETWNGAVLVASANTVVGASGTDWRTLATFIGFAGAGGFLIRTLAMYLRAAAPTRIEVLATGICVFALGSALVIGIGRLGYIRQYADQVFADRYLVWSSLFWSSFALLLLLDVARSRLRSLQFAGIAFLFALPMLLLVTQRTQAGWAGAVYREAQRTAAALRSGVFDEIHFPGNAVEEHEVDLRTVDLLRARNLAMFADPAWQQVGKTWTGTLESNPAYMVSTEPLQPFNDAHDGNRAARFTGRVVRGISAMQSEGQLAILDDAGSIVGLAEYSFVAMPVALRLDLPRKRGFDGYIKNYDPKKKYVLALLDMKLRRGTTLTALKSG